MERARVGERLIKIAGDLAVIAKQDGVQDTPLFRTVGDAVREKLAGPTPALKRELNQRTSLIICERVRLSGVA